MNNLFTQVMCTSKALSHSVANQYCIENISTMVKVPGTLVSWHELPVFHKQSLKKHCYHFQNALLFPLPTQYNVEIVEKLRVHMFNCVGGVEEGTEQV